MGKFNESFKMNSITMNIVNGCNLHFTYCFEKDKDMQLMSAKNAIQIFKTAYDGFEKNFPELKYFMVNLFGGEPTLNWPVIGELAEYIKKNKCKARIGITTNLTRLTDQMLDTIEDSEIFLLVSIDGIKKVHDRNRSGSYDTVIKNLGKLRHRDLLYLVEARMTILPDDAKYMAAGVKELYDFGIQNIAPVPVTDVAWTEEQLEDLRKGTEELFAFYMDLADNMESRKNVAIKVLDDYIEQVLEPMDTEVQPCMAGTNQWCSVGIDGEIMPCHQRHTVKDHQDELRIGNILDNEVDPTKLVNPNRRVALPADCMQCNARGVCRGGCPSENLTYTGNWETPTDSWCKVQRIFAAAASHNQEKLMQAKNLRVKRLRALQLSLEMKKEFDEICKLDILSTEFTTRLRSFRSRLEDVQNVILPVFNIYFAKKLYPVYALFNIEKEEQAQ